MWQANSGAGLSQSFGILLLLHWSTRGFVWGYMLKVDRSLVESTATLVMKMKPASLGALLRNHTRKAHADIDQHPMLRPLVSLHITLAQYAQSLASLHALYSQMEPALGQRVSIGPREFVCRSRVVCLEADLQALGCDPFEDQAGLAWAKPQSPSEAVGVLYVLEGSALGGDMIYGRLCQALPGAPMRFFANGQGLAQARWGQFQSFLQDIENVVEPQRVIVGAERCFIALRQHLDLCLNPKTIKPARLPAADTNLSMLIDRSGL